MVHLGDSPPPPPPKKKRSQYLHYGKIAGQDRVKLMAKTSSAYVESSSYPKTFLMPLPPQHG